MLTPENNQPYIFISYSHADGPPLAKQLAVSFEEHGYSFFLDEHILGGQRWTDEIQMAINRATHMVVVLTPISADSIWVRRETETFAHQKKPIIPAYFKTFDIEKSLMWGSLQYIDFREGLDYDTAIKRLLRSIDGFINVDSEPPPYDWKELPFVDLGVHVGANRLECIRPDDTIDYAHQIISQKGGFKFRHLVVTENGYAGSPILGLLSLRHILKQHAIYPQRSHDKVETIMAAFDPEPQQHPEPLFTYLRDTDTVGRMLTEFITPLTSAPGAGRYFYMSALPIVDQNYNAVGIISFKDVIKAMLKQDGMRLPIPDIPIGQCMIPDPVTATPDETISTMRLKLGAAAQRDIYIVETSSTATTLLGMIPDHILTMKIQSKKLAGEIMVPFDRLRQQIPQTKVTRVLSDFTSRANEVFFSFPVVETKETQSAPCFLGMLGYVEIFQALLQC